MGDPGLEPESVVKVPSAPDTMLFGSFSIEVFSNYLAGR